ncbi:MAG: hypothetical protein ACR2IH_12830 [Pyrinomonadaceae bacterium]
MRVTSLLTWVFVCAFSTNGQVAGLIHPQRSGAFSAAPVHEPAENLGMMDKYDMQTLSPKDLDLFVASRYIDESIRVRLAKLIELRMQINQINSTLETSETEIEAITKDQGRFRENIEALSKTAEAKQLIARYIAKANQQESRLEELNKASQTLHAKKDALERELAIEIKNFEVN